MVFKKMLSAFGVGGPSVDTVLSNPNTRPGLSLDGQVNLQGGDVDADIAQVVVALVTRMEIEGGDVEHNAVTEFHRMPVSGPLKLTAGQALSIPFQLPVPWETPVTDVYDQRLRGMTMGLRTEVAIDRAVDKSDLDAVHVHPLPVQEKILRAFAQLGFQFKNADLEYGHLHGVQQMLPFYQEIEFFVPSRYAHVMREVELTFVANPHTVDVILEADKRGGMFTSGHDGFGRQVVDHATAEQVDWNQRVDEWIRQLAAGYGGQGHHVGHGGHGGHGGRGSVLGGAVVGAALGFAGGMIAGEVLEEVFEGDDFSFDEE